MVHGSNHKVHRILKNAEGQAVYIPVFLHVKTYYNQVIVKYSVYKMICLEMEMFFIRIFLMMENLINYKVRLTSDARMNALPFHDFNP